jgi:hypothetical protein
MDHDRRDAGEMHVFALQHAKRDTGAHPRVDRVAARFQDGEPGFSGEVIRRRHHVARANYARMVGRHAMLVGHLLIPPMRVGCGLDVGGQQVTVVAWRVTDTPVHRLYADLAVHRHQRLVAEGDVSRLDQ